MVIAWSKVLPVIVSIGIIVLVAILREYSKTLAAILATMPLNIPLALWLIYSSDGTDRAVMSSFTQSLFINIFPTMVFLGIAVLAARAGWRIVPMLGASYAGWAVSLGILVLVRQALGG
jgi:hypothetical protein